MREVYSRGESFRYKGDMSLHLKMKEYQANYCITEELFIYQNNFTFISKWIFILWCIMVRAIQF